MDSRKKLYIKTKNIALLFLCFTLLIATVSLSNMTVARADDPAPQLPYKIELENGTKFFYMQGDEYYNDNEDYMDLESGLYYTDNLENIYLIEPIFYQGTPYPRYIYKGSLIISQDGRYFVNMSWTSTGNNATIEFYKKGSLVKQYFLDDLVQDKSKLEYTVSHVRWEDYDKRQFDSDDNSLSVTTLDGITYLFDISTGRLFNEYDNLIEKYDALSDKYNELSKRLDKNNQNINQNNVILNILIIISSVILILIVILFILYIYGKRKQNDTSNQ